MKDEYNVVLGIVAVKKRKQGSSNEIFIPGGFFLEGIHPRLTATFDDSRNTSPSTIFHECAVFLQQCTCASRPYWNMEHLPVATVHSCSSTWNYWRRRRGDGYSSCSTCVPRSEKAWNMGPYIPKFGKAGTSTFSQV